jgi:hypothetical protein
MDKINIPKTDSPEINELISELSSCRDDERSSSNQLTQYIIAVLTALIAAFALGQLSEVTRNYTFQLLLFTLTVFVLCALGAMIISIGVVSTLRHHFMVYLEDRLTDAVIKYNNCNSSNTDQVIHWTSFSKSAITLNIRNIKAKYSSTLFFSTILTLISIIIFGVTVLFIQIIKFDFSKITGFFITYIIFLSIMVVIVISYGVYTFLHYSQKSKEFFDTTKLNANKSRLNRKYAIKNTDTSKELNNNCDASIIKCTKESKKNSCVWCIIYFIYPRLKELQKIIFVIMGFIFGCVLFPQEMSINTIILNLKVLGLSLLITEVLVHQARYQWNDIRGVREDCDDSEIKGNRLPMCLSNSSYVPSIIISLVVLSIKLYIAFCLLIPFYGTNQNIMMYFNIAILVLAFVYEFCRSHQLGNLIIIFVGFGYPIRFIIGLFSARPRLYADLHLSSLFYDLKSLTDDFFNWLVSLFSYPTVAKTPENIEFIILLTAISLAMFGIVFVTLTWALAVAEKPERAFNRPHYKKILKSISIEARISKYPLMQNGSKFIWWNLFFIISIIILSITQLLLNLSVVSVLLAIIPVSFAIFYSFNNFKYKFDQKNKRIDYSIFMSLFYFIIVYIFSRISFNEGNIGQLFMLITIMQIFYSLTYTAFRNTNNSELNKSLQLFFHKVGIFILYIIIGKDTYNFIHKE